MSWQEGEMLFRKLNMYVIRDGCELVSDLLKWLWDSLSFAHAMTFQPYSSVKSGLSWYQRKRSYVGDGEIGCGTVWDGHNAIILSGFCTKNFISCSTLLMLK